MPASLQRRMCRVLRAWCLASGAALMLALSSGAAEPPTRVEPDLMALAKLAMITLPPPPAWPGTPAGTDWSVEDFSAEFAKSSDHAPRILYARTSFVRPPHAWLVAFADWFNRLQKSLKLTYKDDVWDCDDYARCFVAFAEMLALGAGESRGAICMGWATVLNRWSFGGVGAGGGHAIVVVATSNGIFVIEPSNGKMAALGKYPNRDEFEDVNL